MTHRDAMHRLIADLRKHRAAWQLQAELDPGSVVAFASDVAATLEMPREIALRVIEDELGCRPLLDRRDRDNRPTDEIPVIGK